MWPHLSKLSNNSRGSFKVHELNLASLLRSYKTSFPVSKPKSTCEALTWAIDWTRPVISIDETYWTSLFFTENTFTPWLRPTSSFPSRLKNKMHEYSSWLLRSTERTEFLSFMSLKYMPAFIKVSMGNVFSPGYSRETSENWNMLEKICILLRPMS